MFHQKYAQDDLHTQVWKPGVTSSKDSLPLKTVCIFNRERLSATKSSSRSLGTKQLMYYREDSGCQSGSVLSIPEDLLRL